MRAAGPTTSSGYVCGCEWLFNIPMNSQHQRVIADIIHLESELIDKPISSDPNEHVRGVTHLFGMPGEKLPDRI